MFGKTIRCLKRGVEAGLHLGAQITVAKQGKLLLDHAVGENKKGEPLTSDHLMPWLSAGKPLTAVAILQLWEQGKLDLNEPVANTIREFGQNGKSAITVRHILTHIGGFRDGDKVSEHLDWNAAIARVYAATVDEDAIPGETAAYHINGSWFILGELIRRIDGRMPDQFVRQEICEPIGMTNTWMAMPEDVLNIDRDRLGRLHLTSPPSVELHPYLNRERAWTRPRPGSSLRGPTRNLARFYSMLLDQGQIDGRQILKPDTVKAMTSRQRANKFDRTFQHVIDWGWGLIINSNRHGKSTVPYGFGLHAGNDAFGHGGMQSAVGFADPTHGLAVAWVCNGMPGEKLHQLRAREINTAIYEDLGLA
ncbi:serine hydrolase [bacterium]|nr:serine hydrolase [bacterium]